VKKENKMHDTRIEREKETRGVIEGIQRDLGLEHCVKCGTRIAPEELSVDGDGAFCRDCALLVRMERAQMALRESEKRESAERRGE